MFISGPCIVGAEGMKRSSSVSGLITCYSLSQLYNNIFISVSYYKPEFEKIFFVGIQKLFGCVRGSIDENVEVSIWIINRLLPHSQESVSHKQHYQVQEISTSNVTTLQGKEQIVNSMLTNQFQKFSTLVAATTHNSVKYDITRVVMLEPEEVKVILDTALHKLSTDSSTRSLLSRWCYHKLLTVRRKSLVKYIALASEYRILNHQQNLKQLKLPKSNGISTREKEG